jgi:hypothetical protein
MSNILSLSSSPSSRTFSFCGISVIFSYWTPSFLLIYRFGLLALHIPCVGYVVYIRSVRLTYFKDSQILYFSRTGESIKYILFHNNIRLQKNLFTEINKFRQNLPLRLQLYELWSFSSRKWLCVSLGLVPMNSLSGRKMLNWCLHRVVTSCIEICKKQ